jgi:dienelactone hydrolase
MRRAGLRITGISLLAMLVWATASALAGTQGYDPLAVSEARLPQPFDLTVVDTERQREFPIRVYLPNSERPALVVLFSHGLGGSREGNAFMGRHWSARGYAVVFLQHPGSDVSVWQDVPLLQRMGAMRRAANAENTRLRVEDVPAALDALEAWNATPDHRLEGRLDLARVGMSGHSFGAVTTQAVSGQTALRGRVSSTDARIGAAAIFSPSSPRLGDPQQAFGGVAIPWMLMTGTHDLSPIGNADLDSRLGVFPALPPGGKYELVLDGAEHSAFTDRALAGDTEPRNPNHHRVILALSTAFWDAYLRDSAAARTWLDGDGPGSVMEPADRWQRK